MTSYDDENYMIAWDYVDLSGRKNQKAVEVGPWPDKNRWSNKYEATTGCCDQAFEDLDDAEQAQILVNTAASLMFYGVPARESLEEFAKIRVWRDMDIRLPAGTYHAFLPSKGYTSWNPWAG